MHVKLGCLSAAMIACLLGFACSSAAPAPPHSADPRHDGGLVVWLAEQPASIHTDAATEVRYRLAFQAGARTERFALGIRPPQFPGEGSPFLPLTTSDITASGGAQLGSARTSAPEVVCSTVHNVLHGNAPNAIVYDVVIPAHTIGSVELTARLGRDAPWPGMALRPTFEITRDLAADDDGPATVPHDVRIVPVRPRLLGPTGVRIRMHTNPATPRPPRRHLPTFRPGQTIAVHGTTEPRQAHTRIELRAATPTNRRHLRPIATVRTDRRGRFRYRWHPQARGAYELFAFYRTRSKRVTSDRSCPRAFRMG